MKKLVYIFFIFLLLVGCKELKEDEIVIYKEIGRDSPVMKMMNQKDFQGVRFENVFEIVNNKLAGWYHISLEDKVIGYFYQTGIADEVPTYSQMTGFVDETIQLITDKGIVDIKVGMESSFIRVSDLFEKQGYFAVLDKYEKSKWTLVDSRSGEIYRLIGDIITSNDKFLLLNPYGILGGEPNSISIYSFSSGKLEREFLYDGLDWSIEDASWEDDNVLSYFEVYYDNNYKVEKKIKKTLRYDNNNWYFDDSASE